MIYVKKSTGILLKLALITAAVFATLVASATTISAATEPEVVSGNTAAAWDDKGKFLFNRDTSTATPIEFNQDESVLGDGSLYVLPVGSNPADKFIAELFVDEKITDINAISYDFLIGAGGDTSDANEFYMNVYVNFAGNYNYGDCVYNVVPTTASGWTTVSFDPDGTYDVRTSGSAPSTCPGTPSELPATATVRMIAMNLGDTSASDEGLDGYFDNVVIDSASLMAVYDLDPYPVSGEITAPTADEVVRYSTTLMATYDDGDIANDDIVQWAVRQGTCSAGTSTVAGNVDGFSDSFTWDGASFDAVLDTSSFADGEYCFIFNPRDDAGQNNVRETVMFIVNNVPAPEQCTGIYTSVFEETGRRKVIRATSGDDLIVVDGNKAIIYGNGGDDCVYVMGHKAKVRTTDGNDTIIIEGNKAKVWSGAGDDVVEAGNKATVRTYAGDDKVLTGNKSKIWGGDDYDLCEAGAKSTVRECEASGSSS